MARVRKMDEDMKVKYWQYYYGPGIGLPLLLIVIGVWIIGRDLGWWKSSINIWGIILVAIGAYWLLKAVLYNR